MKTVDLIVPCFNEEEVLPEFVRVTNEVIATLPQYRFRYILVNDGSRDKTLLVMMKLAEEFENVKYISFSRNFGKEAAMFAGLEHSDADYVFVMDADLQHPPQMFPQMLREVDEEGHDCCALYREHRKGESIIRTGFSKLFFKLQNAMSSVKMPYGAVDYRVMTRQMVKAIVSMGEVQRFSKGLFTWVGFDTKWLPYKNVERTIGKSSWSFFGLFKYAIDGITAFSISPLRFITVMGFVLFILSGISGAFVVVEELIQRIFHFGYSGTGFATLMCVILFIGGILELSIGILGEYLGRVFVETKKRPIYIAKLTNLEEKDRKNGEN
ncbi:MAG: glycosyltransferase family 2 protein [Eubacteriales bacterium]|nr:glycosyltransferase family 2 protein [Eubacteriales bacterium]